MIPWSQNLIVNKLFGNQIPITYAISLGFNLLLDSFVQRDCNELFLSLAVCRGLEVHRTVSQTASVSNVHRLSIFLAGVSLTLLELHPKFLTVVGEDELQLYS